MKFAAIGIDHRHIFGMADNLSAAGGEFVAWWSEGEPETVDGFVMRFPGVARAGSYQEILDDGDIDMILIASAPKDRSKWSILSMEAAKDVMVDKPGCTTLDQLEEIRSVQERTGQIWSINFSERFEVPSITLVSKLVAEGAIGKVVQTIGIGPHRLNKATRPDWFFEREAYGGILTDIASHQVDQFLFFTGSTDAQLTMANVGNFANPETPGLQDFGELSIKSENGSGYVRVDWYTPDALPTWGDGRLTILGTEGYIEMRKYIDVAGRSGTDHVVLVNNDRCEILDGSDAGLPYFSNLIADVQNRTETAMPQSHPYKVMELTIQAQIMAEPNS